MMEKIICEQSVKLPFSPQKNPPPWQAPLLLTVAKELSPGDKLTVEITSKVGVNAQLFRQEPSGATGALVSNPPESTNVSFEYSVDAPGFYQLKLSQHQLWALVDASLRMTVKTPKPKNDSGGKSVD